VIAAVFPKYFLSKCITSYSEEATIFYLQLRDLSDWMHSEGKPCERTVIWWVRNPLAEMGLQLNHDICSRRTGMVWLQSWYIDHRWKTKAPALWTAS